jgi:hypothetical protein
VKTFVSVVLLICCPLALIADSKPDAKVLERWVGGKWVGEGSMVDSDFSKAMKVSGVTTCGWSPDHVFVICDQAVTVDAKPGRELSIYGYDPEAGKFHFYGTSPSDDKARSMELVVLENGSRLEYRNTDEIKGKPVRFRTVNVFRDDDHAEWWTEYSTDDGQHWTRMGQGKESRQH